MKPRSQDNDIKMYSTHNEEKSVIAERFVRTLKSKIYKYMTSVSEHVYIANLNDIVSKYSNTYHSTINMKPVDATSRNVLTSIKKAMRKNLSLKLVIR